MHTWNSIEPFWTISPLRVEDAPSMVKVVGFQACTYMYCTFYFRILRLSKYITITIYIYTSISKSKSISLSTSTYIYIYIIYVSMPVSTNYIYIYVYTPLHTYNTHYLI